MMKQIFAVAVLTLASAATHAATIEMKVYGLVCGFCAQGIEKALRKLPASGDIVFMIGVHVDPLEALPRPCLQQGLPLLVRRAVQRRPREVGVAGGVVLRQRGALGDANLLGDLGHRRAPVTVTLSTPRDALEAACGLP